MCPLCDHSTRARHNDQDVDSVWRHLDLGCWRLVIKARLRRLRCPFHGVRVEGVPFARYSSGFTRDFECLVAWLAVKTDKSSIERLLRIAWRTVGAIVERVVADELDPDRLNDLFEIGMDEIACAPRGAGSPGGLRDPPAVAAATARSRSFKPLPVRERGIPKKGGKIRYLGIPTLRDRVVQMALKLVLEPIFEADFYVSSYGYRPGRRTQDAIAEIVHFGNTDYEWIIEADIEACSGPALDAHARPRSSADALSS